MATITPYNPLDKINLAKSIENELLGKPGSSFSEATQIVGAGVYVIYYAGPFPSYAPLAEANKNGANRRPIYVGKAIPKVGRKGGIRTDASSTGRALSDRLRQHAASISESPNLEVEDFSVRYLVLDDIWIPLGENMLIETYQPLWNVALDGFGNKDPGRRRAQQYKSPWDVVHPGRHFAEKLSDPPITHAFLIKRIEDYLADRPLDPLPKNVLVETEDVSENEDHANF